MIRSRYRYIEKLRENYAERKKAIRARLAEFATVKPEEYFYELAYCLLTPQSSAVNAGQVVDALKKNDLLNRDIDVLPLLRNGSSYIRFHNTKSRHLLEAKEKFGEILARLTDGLASDELRSWLVENVKGFGWKEASHFLRNIGHRDLAILDRHILKNLRKHGVIGVVPKSLTMKRYLAIEKKYQQFATEVGISVDELDLLFWSRETGQILK